MLKCKFTLLSICILICSLATGAEISVESSDLVKASGGFTVDLSKPFSMEEFSDDGKRTGSEIIYKFKFLKNPVSITEIDGSFRTELGWAYGDSKILTGMLEMDFSIDEYGRATMSLTDNFFRDFVYQDSGLDQAITVEDHLQSLISTAEREKNPLEFRFTYEGEKIDFLDEKSGFGKQIED
jgi:hypothetical protein